jgi:hypothetical protein
MMPFLATQAIPSSLAETPVRNAIEALKLMEAQIESALLNGNRVPDFHKLDVALSTLDEMLKTRGTPNLRAQLRAMWARYEQLGEFWTVCHLESKVYKGELIPLKKATIASLLAREVLTEFPELNRPFPDGGARSPDESWASSRRLLSCHLGGCKSERQETEERLRG